MLVDISRLNFEHYQIKFWRERNLVKGGANPGNRTDTPGNLPSWQGPKSCPEWARMQCSHSYRKGLGNLSHYPGPAGLAGTLPEHPSTAGQFCRWFFLQLGHALSPHGRHDRPCFPYEASTCWFQRLSGECVGLRSRRAWFESIIVTLLFCT